jgi:hypothetical protein
MGFARWLVGANWPSFRIRSYSTAKDRRRWHDGGVAADSRYRHLAGVYFLVQALLIVVWWAVLKGVPKAHRVFFGVESFTEISVLFFVADWLALLPASIGTFVLSLRKPGSAPWAAWFATGASAYALFGVSALAVFSEMPCISSLLMFLSTTASAFCARFLHV